MYDPALSKLVGYIIEAFSIVAIAMILIVEIGARWEEWRWGK